MKLDIQRFASGTITFSNWSSGTPLRGKIEWSSTPNVNEGTSRVSASLYARKTTSTATTGKQWNGYVNIGGNNHSFSQLGSSTSIGSSWVLIKTYTDTIDYEGSPTKTITISGSITGPSGTSLANESSWGSGSAVLDTLHNPPLVSNYTITETNEDLINAGVSDDTFVLRLSKKAVNVSYTLYDDATLSELGVSDGTNVITINDENDLPVIYDLSQFNMVIENDPNNVLKAGIFLFIRDSLGGARIFAYNLVNHIAIKDYYDYIPYNPININNSLTRPKRNGQTSGRVGLTINGTFYNGSVGNVDQSSSYKPTIKYKYWKSGDSEPLSYTNTIPSSSITIDDTSFNVDNFEIGSTIETDPNYFDPQFAYRIKVQVNDNFTTSESNELQIHVGEAVWTEYKDRVDFKALTIQGGPVKGKWTYGGKTTGNATATIPDDTTELYLIMRVDNSDNVAFPMYIPMLPTTTMRYNNGYAQTSAYTSRITVEITDTTIGLVYANLNNNNVLTTSTMEWWYR